MDQDVFHQMGRPPELLLLLLEVVEVVEEDAAALLLSGPEDAGNGPELESMPEDETDDDVWVDVDEETPGPEDETVAALELAAGKDVAVDAAAEDDEPGALEARLLLVLVARDVATVDDAPTDEAAELPVVLVLLSTELELPMTPPPGFWQVALMHSQPARQSCAVAQEKDVSSAEGKGQPATPHPSTTQRTSRCMG